MRETQSSTTYASREASREPSECAVSRRFADDDAGEAVAKSTPYASEIDPGNLGVPSLFCASLCRETYQITEKAEAALFASADATAAAKAGLDAHRSLVLEALWTYARKGYYPIRIDESSPQPGPDGIILPPHPFKNSWDCERAQAVEAETYPEKHPDRVRWHVTNDLKNLGFHSVIFIVDSEEKKSAIQKATEQLEQSLKSRTEIRILKSRA